MRTAASGSRDRQEMGVSTTAFHVAIEPVAASAVSFVNCLVNGTEDQGWKIIYPAMLKNINSDNRIGPKKVNEGNFRLDGQQKCTCQEMQK